MSQNRKPAASAFAFRALAVVGAVALCAIPAAAERNKIVGRGRGNDTTPPRLAPYYATWIRVP